MDPTFEKGTACAVLFSCFTRRRLGKDLLEINVLPLFCLGVIVPTSYFHSENNPCHIPLVLRRFDFRTISPPGRSEHASAYVEQHEYRPLLQRRRGTSDVAPRRFVFPFGADDFNPYESGH